MSKPLVAAAYEDNDASEDDAESNLSSGNSKSVDFDLQESQSLCTVPVCCHICYIMLFLTYLVVFPLWGKWLMAAPMPKSFWHSELPAFPLLDVKDFPIAEKGHRDGRPQIIMTEIPTETSACNYTCGVELNDYRSSLMNFHVDLTLDRSDLKDVHAHTTYPVLMASEDFVNWELVADRRNAYPEPFFRSRSEETGATYTSSTQSCSGQPDANMTFTSQGTYFLGCVMWTRAGWEAVQSATELTQQDILTHCSAVGGVCGWPCGSSVPSDRLPGCSDLGIINSTLITRLPMTGQNRVSVQGCESPVGECATSTIPMSKWKCHKCHVETESTSDAFASTSGTGAAGGSAAGAGEADDWMDNFGRRLESDTGDSEDTTFLSYKSLPRMQIKLSRSQLPQSSGVMSTPRAAILASHSITGPWKRIFVRDQSVDTKQPEPEMAAVAKKKKKKSKAGKGTKKDTTIIYDEGSLYAMTLQRKNSLAIQPDTCFGHRGPLYVVACAVNASIYDDKGQWHGVKGASRFELGQKVAPPPFNDRCLAVTGRCAHACMKEQQTLLHCGPDGYIDQTKLVHKVDNLFNNTPQVMAFVIVLLCGFAVKTLMLCPGIFSPYRHAHSYEPEMTENFRYIVVVSPVAGADENKGTMLRNLIGVVSCMPPECQCRYHAVINDEGHRDQMKLCWQLFCNIMETVPNFQGRSYEENILEFTHIWCAETRMLSLSQIGGKVRELEGPLVDRLSGRSTLKKLMKESRWSKFDRRALAPLEAAIEALAQHLGSGYNKFSPSIAYLDNIGDWAPRDKSLMLRLHYTSRAKPVEDDRNIMVQHVAVGGWYYKVPAGSSTEEWLELRKNCKEMVYAIPDNIQGMNNVPLRSSHGKAGGLNFVDNYIALYARRPENRYGDERDVSPILYAIADARHQFQPDFMISCIPCFFTEGYDLNSRVAFTQAPQHYPEYADKSDYMDYNNAQFFRLNAMIRNCCGGVSSCGTNGMWLIPHRDDDTIWQPRRKRVRDRDNKKRDELIEREQFHTSCKIEDTASSLDQVLVGRHSHFVNRKLSFGMAKAPTDFIGAQQRWVEGAVTLCLQWFSFNADSHGDSARNAWMLWATVLAFLFFIFALVRLIASSEAGAFLVQFGVLEEGAFRKLVEPFTSFVWDLMVNHADVSKAFGASAQSYELFTELVLQFALWIFFFILAFTILWLVTMVCKCFGKCCFFPNEMKWWGRLIISMDNLTYFFWFWTSFFWIGFNYYTALFRMNYHFNNQGMMAFMLVVNVLNWSLIIVNTFRYNIMESMDANEIAALNMDNIWRANQLFFMTGPIQLFSLARGCSEFIKYKFYGQDIGGWSGGDLGRISVNIVKYWTSLMLLGCVLVWVAHATYAHEYQNSFSACIVVTLISLDVLHPCTFLWLGNTDIPREEINKMTWCQALVTRKWWAVSIKNLILNQTFTGVLKYVGPAYFLVLPVLALSSSWFGVSGAYMLVAMGPGH